MALTQVALHDCAVLSDRCGVASQQDLSFGHEVDLVAEVPDHVEVVLDDHHSSAL